MSDKAVRKSARITAGARQLAEAAQLLAGVRIINPPQTPSPSSSNNSNIPTPPLEPQSPIVTHNPPTTSAMADLRLQELHTATKFRGFSGLSVADFIIDIESAIVLVVGGLWVIVGDWGSIGGVGMSLLLEEEGLGVCGGLMIRTPAKIWAASASCLAPAVMRALFRTALSLMNESASLRPGWQLAAV